MNVQYYRDKWDEIHRNAAKTVHGRWSHRDYCEWIRGVPYQLPCKTCRNHALSYLQSNPPEHSSDLFEWSWRFHNSVNARTDKKFYSYEQAAWRYGV